MKKKIVSMLAISVLVFSCKKDDDKSTSELLQGKWNVINIYEHEYDNGVCERDTATYAPGVETIELTGSGKAYYAGVNSNGSTYQDTGVYKLDGSNLILDVVDTFQIININSSDLQLYNKYVRSSTEYDEMWVNLKK
jgi:hypothetical protein